MEKIGNNLSEFLKNSNEYIVDYVIDVLKKDKTHKFSPHKQYTIKNIAESAIKAMFAYGYFDSNNPIKLTDCKEISICFQPHTDKVSLNDFIVYFAHIVTQEQEPSKKRIFSKTKNDSISFLISILQSPENIYNQTHAPHSYLFERKLSVNKGMETSCAVLYTEAIGEGMLRLVTFLPDRKLSQIENKKEAEKLIPTSLDQLRYAISSSVTGEIGNKDEILTDSDTNILKENENTKTNIMEIKQSPEETKELLIDYIWKHSFDQFYSALNSGNFGAFSINHPNAIQLIGLIKGAKEANKKLAKKFYINNRVLAKKKQTERKKEGKKIMAEYHVDEITRLAMEAENAMQREIDKLDKTDITDEDFNAAKENMSEGINIGDTGMWHGAERKVKWIEDPNLTIVEIDDNGKEIGDYLRVSIDSFKKEFAKFPSKKVGELSDRAEGILSTALAEYEKSSKKEELVKIVNDQLVRNRQAGAIGFELDKDMVDAGVEFLKRVNQPIELTGKDLISIALQDVISVKKYGNLELAEAKVLYALDGKLINEEFSDNTTLHDSINQSLYDMGYIEYGEEGSENEYQLSDIGKEFISAVNARIHTLQNKDTDLFPEDIGIVSEPERIYADLKSCLLEEGDNEGVYIFEGKEFTIDREKWKFVSFFKYGAVVEHISKHKLHEKKESKKLTFDEIRQLMQESDISIDGINGIEGLNHCLKLLKKCIDFIDLQEAHKHTESKLIESIKIVEPEPIIEAIEPDTYNLSFTEPIYIHIPAIVHLKEENVTLIYDKENFVFNIMAEDRIIGVISEKKLIENLDNGFYVITTQPPIPTENTEWLDAISTLELLLQDEPDNTEWKEAIETLKMLM